MDNSIYPRILYIKCCMKAATASTLKEWNRTVDLAKAALEVKIRFVRIRF